MGKEFKIASHNSMSYLPVKAWYLKPFAFMARCQSIDVFKQYDLGIRHFDIRLNYSYNGIPRFAHGMCVYEGNAMNILHELHEYATETITLRIIHETNKQNKFRDNLFIDDCKRLRLYPKFRCYGGNRKYDWYRLFKFCNPEPSLDQKVSSMTWKVLDDWCPWLYARLMNKKNIKKGTKKDYLMLDFVNIR